MELAELCNTGQVAWNHCKSNFVLLCQSTPFVSQRCNNTNSTALSPKCATPENILIRVNGRYKKQEGKFLHFAENQHVLLIFVLHHVFPTVNNSVDITAIEVETASFPSLHFSIWISPRLQSTVYPIHANRENSKAILDYTRN